METKIQKDDLSLKDLDQFYGTECYYKIPLFRSNLTEGAYYVLNNGYAWFITDNLAIIEHHPKVKDEPFKVIELKVNTKDKTAIVKITDGDNNVLYKQEIKYTNAQRDLTLYHCNNVLMLAREY